ncbi:hypothetical protein BpHYR1_048156 [Brachionus plicatilis]|nr:hypothetical protein BpHYR1_048156 [Brachionus plicatilis]
MLGALR